MPDLVTPEWLADAVFYQIFPERFANGDPTLDPPGVEPWDAAPTRENFFGGDLAGITQHLDHLVSIGVNAIYLTPIFQADTNHRYDATDYFAIDHRLGDLDAFRVFVREAHTRGIRIVLDAVLNHCGEGHPAFRDVIRNEADSEYVNWFSVEGFPVVQHPEPNYRTCSGCWYLPKWNAYNPEVRAHHLDVARHWIAEGIDGWRLDVPYFINHTFWREFRQVVKGLGDELYIVAEEWRDPGEWLQGDLADGTMNYTLRDLVLGFTADRTIDAAAFASGMNELTERIPQPARRAMLNLLGSHDTERVLTRHGEDQAATVLAFRLLLASEGAPMIYYGDEVGLRGENDPGCRGTMPWEEARWRTGILEAVREATALRAREVVLRRGAQRVVALATDVVAIVRFDTDRALATIVNRASAPVSIDTGALDEVLGPAATIGGRWTGADAASRVIVPAAGTVVSVKGEAG